MWLYPPLFANTKWIELISIPPSSYRCCAHLYELSGFPSIPKSHPTPRGSLKINAALERERINSTKSHSSPVRASEFDDARSPAHFHTFGSAGAAASLLPIGLANDARPSENRVSNNLSVQLRAAFRPQHLFQVKRLPREEKETNNIY